MASVSGTHDAATIVRSHSQHVPAPLVSRTVSAPDLAPQVDRKFGAAKYKRPVQLQLPQPNSLFRIKSLAFAEAFFDREPNPPSLALFDIDLTLVQRPKAGLYSEDWWALAKQPDGGGDIISPEQVQQGKDLVPRADFAERFPTRAVEPEATLDLFKFLDANGITTCGFTARPPRWIPSTAAQLKAIGVDFSSNKDPWDNADYPKQDGTYFVLNEHKTPKGGLLPKILEHELGANWRLHGTVYIDDKVENLRGALEAASQADYHLLTALHYVPPQPHAAQSSQEASLKLMTRQIHAGLTGAAIPAA